jgi:hypothetical protein
MPKFSETKKDWTPYREADVAKTQRDRRRGELRDYSLQHTVEIRWDLNEDAMRDRVVELIIDGDTHLLLDAEQLERYLRWS